MSEGGRTGVVWAGLGCGSLSAWCAWSAISTTVPWPMLAVNGLMLAALVVALVLPAGRRIGGAVAGRLVPGRASGFLVVGLVVLNLASGVALAILALVSPPPQPELRQPAPDGSEVAARDGNHRSRGATEPSPPTPVPETPPQRVEDGEDLAETEPSDPARQEQAETQPLSDDEVEIEAEVSREIDRRPTADPHARVGQRRRMSPDEVFEAVARVGEYRNQLADDVRRVARRGVVGRVETSIVTRTEDGAFTGIISLTVFGCPGGGRLPDQDLDSLAQTALRQIAQNLGEIDVDAYRATLWYEGVGCSRHSLGYSATWTRAGNRLRLR